ncbi:hypothetical protein BGW80DRAFT_594948 [Lactifluus volemus]|nr:hypothetical protein BGW80DRAFT_594948 [Lactifluus volemus]
MALPPPPPPPLVPDEYGTQNRTHAHKSGFTSSTTPPIALLNEIAPDQHTTFPLPCHLQVFTAYATIVQQRQIIQNPRRPTGVSACPTPSLSRYPCLDTAQRQPHLPDATPSGDEKPTKPPDPSLQSKPLHFPYP